MDPNRVEAERLLRIVEKLLHSRDLSNCRNFAILAQEIEQLLDGSDQILAITDVLLAADKRVNNHLDWYTVHQVEAHGGWRWLWVGRRGDAIAKLHLHRLVLLIPVSPLPPIGLLPFECGDHEPIEGDIMTSMNLPKQEETTLNEQETTQDENVLTWEVARSEFLARRCQRYKSGESYLKSAGMRGFSKRRGREGEMKRRFLKN
ncbi:hypothetical protein ACE6H2_018228 [Prunus campanulata]